MLLVFTHTTGSEAEHFGIVAVAAVAKVTGVRIRARVNAANAAIKDFIPRRFGMFTHRS